MNENEYNEVIDSQNDTEETVNEVEIDFDLDDNHEEEIDIDALKKENLTLKAQKDHWKKKANEKKEATPNVAHNSSLNPIDIIAVVDAKVHADDLSEVLDYAKYKGISVTEALKSSVVKTLLSDKKEQRQTALATNTGKARPSSSRLPDDVVLRNASQGKLPDDPADIVAARFAQRGK